jgi:outer membrane protein assembly factor BamB
MTNAPQRLWTIHLDQAIIQSPQAVGDILFLATKLPEQRGKHSALQAINLADGTLRWQYVFEYALINGLQPYYLLAEQQNIVIVATGSSNLLRGQGDIYAFTPSGNVVWQWQGEAQHYSAPTVKERQLFVTASANTLLIISPEAEGDDAVQIPLPVTASVAAPVIYGPTIYIPCRTPDLLAMSLNGDVLWHFQTHEHKADWLDQSPVIADKTLFTVSRQGTIFAINALNGQHLWRHSLGDDRLLSRPAVDTNHLYVGSQYGLHVLDPHSGQTIWTFPTTRAISASPLIVGNTVYVACEDHFIYALDLESGQEQWRLEMSRRLETPPLLASTCLLIADRGGTIVALEPPIQPETHSVQAKTSGSQEQKRLWAEAHEAQGNFTQAAQLWRESGSLEKAAVAYEQGHFWQEAADLWQQVDRYGKRAEALEKYAASLTAPTNDDETMAVAWEAAARAYAEIGQREDRHRCEREAARYRQLPILTIKIEPEAMVIGRWSKLNYTVRNEGFGSARNLDVKLIGGRFEAHVASTATMITLLPDRTYQNWFDVSPRVSGQHVPLQLSLEYLDKINNVHHLEHTFHVIVTSESQADTTASGTRDRMEFAALVSLDGRDLAILRRQLVTSFSSEELNEIIFDLGLLEDDFKVELSPKARELIIWAVQNHQMERLIIECQKRRPHIEW